MHLTVTLAPADTACKKVAQCLRASGSGAQTGVLDAVLLQNVELITGTYLTI